MNPLFSTPTPTRPTPSSDSCAGTRWDPICPGVVELRSMGRSICQSQTGRVWDSKEEGWLDLDVSTGLVHSLSRYLSTSLFFGVWDSKAGALATVLECLGRLGLQSMHVFSQSMYQRFLLEE